MEPVQTLIDLGQYNDDYRYAVTEHVIQIVHLPSEQIVGETVSTHWNASFGQYTDKLGWTALSLVTKDKPTFVGRYRTKEAAANALVLALVPMKVKAMSKDDRSRTFPKVDKGRGWRG